MKITIVTGPFNPLPPAGCGAAEKIWSGLAHEFVANGHQVTFLCRAHPTLVSNETSKGVAYVRRTRFRRSNNIYWDLVKDMIYSLRMLFLLPKSDILITNVFWLPLLVSLFLPKIAKLVVNVARFPKGQIPLYQGADRLAVPSQAILKAIEAQCPKVIDKVKIIPNPIDISAFKPPSRQRQMSGEQIILFTGRVHPEKGVHILIDAFAKLYKEIPSLRLRIIGPTVIEEGGGGKNYLNQLKEKALGLPVEFVGPIYTPTQLAKALQSAHFYCYPSLADKGESFGIAPLEAMATGLVPVVSNLACFRDFIDDGDNGIFFDHRAPNPIINLAAALKSIIVNPEKAKLMGKKAAERAKSFSYQNVAKLYLEDFQNLLASKSATN